MKDSNGNTLMSIGGLSRASGIPVETLRNWERRYGFPEPVRRDSGHRRYPFDVVPRLSLIRKAIETGYKPSFCVVADELELRKILDKTPRETHVELNDIDRNDILKELEQWHFAVGRLDANSLETSLQRAWLTRGAVRFVTDMLVPFLREVGERWFNQSHTVAHEHFASEITMSFLGRKWRPLSGRATGPKVVLANFEGELHCLGLHMAAVFLVLNNTEIIFLGPNTPVVDITVAASERGTVAVVIGMAASSDLAKTARHLRELQKNVPSKLVTAVGGNESLPEIPGVTQIESFEDFHIWAKALAEGNLGNRWPP